MDLIIDLYKYFSQFVPKQVLKNMFIQPDKTQKTGYEEVKAEIMSSGNSKVIDEIKTFVVSINNDFVDQRIKGAKGIILFVEYGKISLNHEQADGIKEALSVVVVNDFSIANNDNLNEILLMNDCLNILDKILRAMQEDQEIQRVCGTLITYPVEVQVVDPKSFHGRGGWCAIFENSKTIL